VEFTLKHPNDRSRVARYGFDADRGHWAEVEDGGMVVACDRFEVGFDDEPVISVLHLLRTYGFIDGDNIADAFEWPSLPPDWRCRRPPRGVLRVLRVIRDLEAAAW
jgi:hypothetical protein